jgi:hypothetical protein
MPKVRQNQVQPVFFGRCEKALMFRDHSGSFPLDSKRPIAQCGNVKCNASD